MKKNMTGREYNHSHVHQDTVYNKLNFQTSITVKIFQTHKELVWPTIQYDSKYEAWQMTEKT